VGNVQHVVRLAYEQIYATATEEDRDAILRAMTEALPPQEAETAARILHHRHEARSLQLTLGALAAERRNQRRTDA